MRPSRALPDIAAWRWEARVLGLASVAMGVAIGSLASAGRPGELLLALGLWLLVMAVARRTDPTVSAAVCAVVSVAFAARIAIAVPLHFAMLALGREYGYVVGDDGTYGGFADLVVQTFRGATGLVTEGQFGYLLGAYAYVNIGIDLVFGTDALAMKILNPFLLALAGIFFFDLARRLLRQGVALWTTALFLFYPSIFVWSILNLKDSFALLLITFTIWAVVTTVSSADPRPLALALTSLWLLQSVRLYLFAALATLVPLALLVSALPRRSIAVLTSCALAVSLTLILMPHQALLGTKGIDISDRSLDRIAQQRHLSAIGARTSLIEPTPGIIDPSVSTAGPTVTGTSGSSGSATARPRVPSTARPGVPSTRRPGATASPARSPGTSPSAAGTDEPDPFTEPPDMGAVTDPPSGSSPEQASTRSLRSIIAALPVGIVNAVLAPRPWDAETVSDYLTIPQMLLWYALVVFALIGTWAVRRDWRRWAIVAGYAGAAALIFAVGEGNAGTLFRHRAMVEPFVMILAASGLMHSLEVARRVRTRASARRPIGDLSA